MGVFDGQAVDAAVTNPAFINKNQDDVMPNKLGFSRPLSGPSIADIQQAVNNLYTATGVSEVATGTQYNATANTITNGDPYLIALTKLADKFDAITGHMHTGNPGDGPHIAALHSIAASGYTPITGDAVLVALSGMSISASGNNIYFTASGGSSGPATTGSLGGVILSSSPSQSVGPSNTSGNPNTLVANADHAHQGVHSLAVSGGSVMYGDVVLAASGGMVLSASGNTIYFSATGGGSGSDIEWKNDLVWSITGAGAVTNLNVYYRQVGDSYDIRGSFIPGTVTATPFSLNFPSGVTIDTTKISSDPVGTIVGTLIGQQASVLINTNNTFGYMFYDGSTNDQLFVGLETNSSGNMNKSPTNDVLISNQDASFSIQGVPISGLSGGGGGGGAGTVRETHGSAASPILINPTEGIVPTSSTDQVWWVAPLSGSGQVIITATPPITSGGRNSSTGLGDRLSLKSTASANYLQIPDVSGVDEDGDLDMGTFAQAVNYTWDGSSWSEDFRRV